MIKIKGYDNSETGCCMRFNPIGWDGRIITWKNKLFVKDRILSFFHIPLNFGKIVKKLFPKINNADAFPQDYLALNDENSLWGSDFYVAVSKEVPDAINVKISGKFLTKVFEGSFKEMGRWIKDMENFVKSKGKTIEKLYFYYTTCPKCAKKFGKNYVVIFAKIG